MAVGAVLTQFDGLLEGYNARVSAAVAAAAPPAEATEAGSGSAGVGAVSGSSNIEGGTSLELEEQRRRALAGFGQRPIPPPLTRADLLMVSAVGERC